MRQVSVVCGCDWANDGAAIPSPRAAMTALAIENDFMMLRFEVECRRCDAS
jgi:hypothetical protein